MRRLLPIDQWLGPVEGEKIVRTISCQLYSCPVVVIFQQNYFCKQQKYISLLSFSLKQFVQGLTRDKKCSMVLEFFNQSAQDILHYSLSHLTGRFYPETRYKCVSWCICAQLSLSINKTRLVHKVILQQGSGGGNGMQHTRGLFNTSGILRTETETGHEHRKDIKPYHIHHIAWNSAPVWGSSGVWKMCFYGVTAQCTCAPWE